MVEKVLERLCIYSGETWGVVGEIVGVLEQGIVRRKDARGRLSMQNIRWGMTSEEVPVRQAPQES